MIFPKYYTSSENPDLTWPGFFEKPMTLNLIWQKQFNRSQTLHWLDLKPSWWSLTRHDTLTCPTGPNLQPYPCQNHTHKKKTVNGLFQDNKPHMISKYCRIQSPKSNGHELIMVVVRVVGAWASWRERNMTTFAIEFKNATQLLHETTLEEILLVHFVVLLQFCFHYSNVVLDFWWKCCTEFYFLIQLSVSNQLTDLKKK